MDYSINRENSSQDGLEALKSIVRFNGISWNNLNEEQRNELGIKLQNGKIKSKIIIEGVPLEKLDYERKRKLNKIFSEAIGEALEKVIEKKIEIMEKSLQEIKILSFDILNYIKDIE